MTGSQSLRIVHCFRSPVGGIFRHVRDLATAQAQAGHSVAIVCDSSTGGTYEDALFDEIAPALSLGHHRLPMQRRIGPGDIVSTFRTFGLLHGLRPDVLHGHGAKGGFLARAFGTAMRLRGARPARLYSPHGGVLHYDPARLSGRALFTVERQLERASDHILFVSDHEKRAYLAKIGTPRAPHSLVYNGLRPEEFDPVEPAPDAADFVYVGMMRDLKGPDLFLHALSLASAATGRPLSAAMIGDGEGVPRYQAQAQALGLADRVSFSPAMPARQAFARGLVLIVPSRAEAMPYIVLEAVAAHMAVIATNVGGIPEIFQDGTVALPEPDADALAHAMTAAARDRQGLMASMPPPEKLRERFSARAMASAIETIYRQSVSVRMR